ncbi:hypothetical protein ACGFX8_33515 [Streptomyces sp. NPDC048362]|uniref:hypothetical protein n=1 Tax=Streptomyces sp. NPDC048362 TaxID=3365539 RepID=UPI00371653F5
MTCEDWAQGRDLKMSRDDLIAAYGDHVNAYLAGVPTTITSANEDDSVLAIVRNITNSGFKATGERRFYAEILRGHVNEGDCGTLTDMFIEVTEALGIKEAKVKQRGACVVRSNQNILGGKDPNIDNGMWVFVEHYWVEHKGRGYDLLFGGVDPSEMEVWDVIFMGYDDMRRYQIRDAAGHVMYQSAAEYIKTSGRAFTVNPAQALCLSEASTHHVSMMERAASAKVSCIIL